MNKIIDGWIIAPDQTTILGLQIFLAVQDSSIGDLVTEWVIQVTFDLQ